LWAGVRHRPRVVVGCHHADELGDCLLVGFTFASDKSTWSGPFFDIDFSSRDPSSAGGTPWAIDAAEEEPTRASCHRSRGDPLPS
jgi:hypothetical protein